MKRILLALFLVLTAFVAGPYVSADASEHSQPVYPRLSPTYTFLAGAKTYDDVANQFQYEKTKQSEFKKYCNELAKSGYKCVSKNTMGVNRFASYSNGEYLICVSYYGTTGLLNVVSEQDYPKSLWSIESAPGKEKALMVQTYQDNVKYTKNQPTGYVVRLSDGRFFVYDTGHDETAAQLMEIMRARNVFTDGKVHIAMIILSHPHTDHIDGLPVLAEKYKDEIVCEAVAYNMVHNTRQSYWKAPALQKAQNRICAAARQLGAEIYCLRGGQKLNLAGASLEVLFTPDELGDFFLVGRDENGKKDTNSDLNNTSNIVRLTVGGQRITFTGDCRGGEAEIFNKLVLPVFESDIMTVAHHGFNVSKTLEMYQKARPSVLFWPVRTDKQAINRYFDKQLMAAPYVTKHFFLDTIAEIEL